MNVAGFTYLDLVSGRRKCLPQVRLEAHTSILSSVSRTTLTQTFINASEHRPELRYSFPLYDGVSVVGFTCTIGERVIKGVVKEKHKARQVYQEAVDRGETAGLLEQLPDSSDIFTTIIGNIPANAEIKVEVIYLGELKHDAQIDGIRFVIPTAIAPRYGQYPAELATPVVHGDKRIRITIDVDVPEGTQITSIQSPSHQLAVTLGKLSTAPDADLLFSKASATLSLGTSELGHDFVIQIKTTNTGEPVALIEEHVAIPNQRALLVTLVPKFALPPEKPEIVFVCDRSGSMSGKIPELQSALRLFIKSLRVGMKFNICSFGSNHTFLWDRSRSYDVSSVQEAMKHVDQFSANYGGTEIYSPIEDAFKRRYTDMNLEVFLLTDGEVWNQNHLFKMISDHVDSSNGAIRLFTLGIGHGASHALIEGAARAGNGFSQSVIDGEEMSSKVTRMLKGAIFPHVKNYSLEVNYPSTGTVGSEDDFEVIEKASEDTSVSSRTTTLLSQNNANPLISLYDKSIDLDANPAEYDSNDKYSDIPTVDRPNQLQTPFEIPPLFPFSRTNVYMLLAPNTDQRTPLSVTLRGTSTYGPLELNIPIATLQSKGETIHQLAAKKAVQELEEGRGWIFHARSGDSAAPQQLLKEKYDGKFQDMVEREAVSLGVQYQVGGKWCSFVAVERNAHDGREQTYAEATTWHNTPSRELQEGHRALPRKSPSSGVTMGSFGSIQSALPPSLPSSLMTLRQSNPARLQMSRAAAGPQRKESKNSTPGFAGILGRRKSPSEASSCNFTKGSFTPAPMPDIHANAYCLAAKEKSSTAPAPPSDKLQSLVILQQFDGSWAGDQKLFDLMGWDKDKIKAVVIRQGIATHLVGDISATACVIAWLQNKKSEDKDIWELLVEKAMDWLGQEISEALATQVIQAVATVI